MKIPAQVLLDLIEQDEELRSKLDHGKTRWTMVRAGNGDTGKYKLMRNRRPEVLYRGQNRIYDPCWPSICRGFNEISPAPKDLKLTDRARLLRGLALNSWFEQEFNLHPMMQWALSANLEVNCGAIAQHYGIPTGYIDASESFGVSAFFATCRYSSDQGWSPADSGEGVMYRLHVDALGDRVRPIAYQPLPRPTRQWAWTIELLLGEDFVQAPMLQQLRFDHDPTVGEAILKMYDYGKALLPDDPTARLAARMCSASDIPIEHIEHAEAQLSGDPNGLDVNAARAARETLHREFSIQFSQSSAVRFTAEELKEATLTWEQEREAFTKSPDVGFMLLRTRPRDETNV